MFTLRSSLVRWCGVVAVSSTALVLALSGCSGDNTVDEQLQPAPLRSGTSGSVPGTDGESGGDPAAASPGSTGAWYAAFGDSYSAGEGTNAYLPGTDVQGVNVCHRSTLAYSQLLATQPGVRSTAFAACSGAVTADMFAPNNNGNRGSDGSPEPAQLCQAEASEGIEACGPARPPALGPDTEAVSVTIGGNDAGFARVVESCVFGTAGRYSVGLPGRRCRYDPVTIERELRRIAALAGRGHQVSPYGSEIHPVSSVLAAMHAAAPDAQVYIAGYPRIFQPSTDDDCVVGAVTEGASRTIPLKVGAADARALDDAATALNTVLKAAAAGAGSWASYVDPSEAFAGHGLCSSSSWINPVQASVAFDSAGRSVSVTADPGSVHPTAEGQQGYREALLAAGFGTRP